MGNGGTVKGSAALTRAEAAAMAVNYQPESPDGCKQGHQAARLTRSRAPGPTSLPMV